MPGKLLRGRLTLINSYKNSQFENKHLNQIRFEVKKRPETKQNQKSETKTQNKYHEENPKTKKIEMQYLKPKFVSPGSWVQNQNRAITKTQTKINTEAKLNPKQKPKSKTKPRIEPKKSIKTSN